MDFVHWMSSEPHIDCTAWSAQVKEGSCGGKQNSVIEGLPCTICIAKCLLRTPPLFDGELILESAQCAVSARSGEQITVAHPPSIDQTAVQPLCSCKNVLVSASVNILQVMSHI